MILSLTWMQLQAYVEMSANLILKTTHHKNKLFIWLMLVLLPLKQKILIVIVCTNTQISLTDQPIQYALHTHLTLYILISNK